jgi:iduronate 2-sulfatase
VCCNRSLFFYIDDMRPETGFMKDPLAYSPNMDAIATEGTVFERAYTQLAVSPGWCKRFCG